MNKAIERADSFFTSLATKNMTEPEAVLYRLKVDRENLVRTSSDYHRARLHLQSTLRPGAALDAALVTLHKKYPGGYRKTELAAVNAAITKATVALHRFRTSNL